MNIHIAGTYVKLFFYLIFGKKLKYFEEDIFEFKSQGPPPLWATCLLSVNERPIYRIRLK